MTTKTESKTESKTPTNYELQNALNGIVQQCGNIKKEPFKFYLMKNFRLISTELKAIADNNPKYGEYQKNRNQLINELAESFNPDQTAYFGDNLPEFKTRESELRQQYQTAISNYEKVMQEPATVEIVPISNKHLPESLTIEQEISINLLINYDTEPAAVGKPRKK